MDSLWGVLALLFCMVSVPGAWSVVDPKTDFLHLDCGASKEYTDKHGITWHPDDAFVSTGKIARNLPNTDWPEEKALRYFKGESRTKNCFTLPVKPRSIYIMRLGFYHGGYDKSMSPPSFQLGLDSTIFETVSILDVSDRFIHEVTFQTAARNETSLCLVQDPSGSTPFISNIALRAIEKSMVSEFITGWLDTNQIVTTQTRFYLGGSQINKNIIKHLGDPYDRYWYPSANGSYTNSYPMRYASIISCTSTPVGIQAKSDTRIGTSSVPIYLSETPQDVLRSGMTTNGNLTIDLDSSVSFKAYIQYYFVELDLTTNKTDRSFYLVGPGETEPFLVNVVNRTRETLKLYGVYNDSANIGPGSKNFFYPDPFRTSMKGPILTAMEIYKICDPLVAPTNDRDWAAIESIKVDMNLTSWRGDPCLPKPHHWINCSSVDKTENPAVLTVVLSAENLTGAISPSFNDLLDLTTLKLDGNSLTGQLPDLSALTNLKTLHLQDNALSGPLPEWLAFLPKLRELIVQNNNFSGKIPSAFSSKNWNFTYYGNPLLNATLPASPSTNTAAIVGGVAGGVAFVAIVVALVYYLVCRRNRRPAKDMDTLIVGNSNPNIVSKEININLTSNIHGGARKFSPDEIVAATANYKKVIGRGGFGPVYYGRLTDGREVAVKVLDKESRQGETEFLNEVDILSRVHHKHLVNLVGYCRVPGMQMMLIYEYIHRGSLRDHLSGTVTSEGSANSGPDVLDWKTRLNIALHAASGLEYLHKGCSPSLIHRDVKSSNILITTKYEGRLTDFGLSRLVGDEDITKVVTFVKGTAGYLDPEYFSTNVLSAKSDVFSFGVVLLELITGRLPVDRSKPTEWNICDWVRASLAQGNIEAILDPAVRASHPNVDALWKVAEIALQSVEPRSKHRPTINEVVLELTGAIALEGSASNDSSYGLELRKF
ncbi:probable LRR receptor-like serine/threonine-protein kinase At1g67720 isoform X2 [Physcomitrium patens]|uniref:non-specific serine/threonine protein kinase n=1 Tax=Physcomitrium patens TaxID=3218 RepID=A0A2K1L9E1_PHYPA|nr:probable LRR receptor-like serine/threonine-protein kinase At1g67720 isoform X2 [Physcomitrium patens]PNR62621.1 hypothetical protein PHYPA_001045 [Physcomitrium patens]|eukprot:XP_024374859.1 probable LRR receptor-like serine/threonine-protein kinase At1g67720 isoform X2 [Physcomitrella patens]